MKRALLTAALALLFAAPAQAATFQVTTNADTGTCNAVACSLSGAVAAAVANGATEDDLINVPPGTYATTQVSMSGANASRITIAGAGANTTVWEPSGANRPLSISGTFTPTTTVIVRDLTLRNGRSTGAGGNLVVNGAAVTLQRVRVTGGQAAGGGGIQVTGSSGPATLTVLNSLIDNNAATAGNDGGGLISLQITNGASMSFQDSTIAFNTADRGGGVYMTSTNGITLRGATVAYNKARTSGTGVGGIQSTTTQPATIQGSLFAGNTSPFITSNGTINIPANCSFGAASADGGGNVEDNTQCGLGAGSRTNAVPQLATALDAAQQPPTLNIPETSPAVDFAACGTRTTDQRGMTRPLGVTCDAGAYEFDPRPDTAVQGAAPPFTLTSSDAGSTFQCSLDGAAFVPCATPYDPGAAPGTHTLTVRAVDAQGNIDPTPATTTFTVAAPPTPTASPTPTPTPTPTPVVNKTVVVREVKGTIKVKLPGTTKYINLDVTRGIPVKSTVDARDGTVELTSIPKAGAPPETAKFFDGIFKVTQSKGITTLTLTETLAACPKPKKAGAAASKPKKRRLWGDGKGKFRTEGKYAAATVRGTKWLVEDTCAGTLTKVNQGTVDVRDKVRHKTIIVRKGKSYLAKPKR